MLEIKSCIDVITNSSTEVFTYVTEEGVAALKNIIDGIIAISGGNGKCDDYFNIEMVMKENALETAKEYYEDEHWKEENDGTYVEPTEEQLREYVLKLHRDSIKHMESGPMFDNLKISAKDPKNQEFADFIFGNISKIIQKEEFYC